MGRRMTMRASRATVRKVYLHPAHGCQSQMEELAGRQVHGVMLPRVHVSTLLLLWRTQLMEGPGLGSASERIGF